MKLIDYIPVFLRKSKLIKAIFSAFEHMLDLIKKDSMKVRENIFIISSDENIQMHEEDVGIINDSEDITLRRARVISHLRGWNVTTISEISGLVKAYGFGDCSITENYAEYSFIINTTAPKNSIFYKMCEAVEEVKPAHLFLSGVEIESTKCDNNVFYAMPQLRHSVINIQADTKLYEE